MHISNKLPVDLSEVDMIICGGGTAGCTVAGRLAEADPNLSVLLIEGGENNANLDHIRHPALLLQNQLPATRTAIFYQANKSEALGGRAPVIPSGGVLGGGSSINLMLYSRAQGVDFDEWNTPGWSGKELVPFMEKLESYYGPGKATHGHNGPVEISAAKFQSTKAREDIIQTASRLGYKIYDDLEDPTQVNNGWERAQKYVTREGFRADAAHAYIHPLLNDGKRSNLHVLTESKVVRVLFDEDKRAVGVEYTTNPQYLVDNDAFKAVKLTAKARKLVVLSSGACGTPLVLQRSGVGAREVLEKASVPVIADVKGVGRQYDDHTLLVYSYQTNLAPEETLDGLMSGRMSPEKAAEIGLLGFNGIDTHAKLRPTEDEVKSLGPKFEEAWNRDYRDKPNKPLVMMASAMLFLGNPALVPEGQYISFGVYSGYDNSRGKLLITGPNLDDPIDFDVGYFTDKDGVDIKKHVWAYKRLRALVRSTEMYRGEVGISHPEFPEGSKAACVADADAKSIVREPEYTAEDDDAIEKFIRANVATTWHSMGTCLMAPEEKRGVVDADLNVYGVQGLKCVDLSIAQQIAANTNNTAFVVGEKGADVIIRELGLK